MSILFPWFLCPCLLKMHWRSIWGEEPQVFCPNMPWQGEERGREESRNYNWCPSQFRSDWQCLMASNHLAMYTADMAVPFRDREILYFIHGKAFSLKILIFDTLLWPTSMILMHMYCSWIVVNIIDCIVALFPMCFFCFRKKKGICDCLQTIPSDLKEYCILFLNLKIFQVNISS